MHAFSQKMCAFYANENARILLKMRENARIFVRKTLPRRVTFIVSLFSLALIRLIWSQFSIFEISLEKHDRDNYHVYFLK